MTIRIYGPGEWGYSIEINGEIFMECLSEDEMKALTLGEIINLWMEMNDK